MKAKEKAVLAAFLLLAGAPRARAVQLETMVQGYLTTPAGAPYTTTQAVEFKLYQGGSAGSAGTGTLVYDETASVTPSGSGVFAYILGSGTPVGGLSLSTSTFDTALPVYVEISVGGSILLPRLQLTGMPFAAIAGVAESVKTLNQTLSVNGSIAASGAFYGDGSHLSGVGGMSPPASSVSSGTFGPGVLLPAANLTAGPVPAAMLPGGIAYTGSANNFAQPQTISGGDAGAPSLATSSGIAAASGMISAPAFSGAYYGDGSHLSGVGGTNPPASSVSSGTFGPGVLLPAANLTAGPVPAAMLPGGIAYMNNANNFTQPQSIVASPGSYSLNTSSGINVDSGMVNAPAFNGAYYGDGSHLGGLGSPPIGSIIAFAGAIEPAGWVECNGRVLSQAGSASASWGTFNAVPLFAAIGAAWGSPGSGQFNLPDLRGVFPRGWNHGKTGSYSDPDAGSRAAPYAGGAAGDAVGSYETDQLRSHTHGVPSNADFVQNPSGQGLGFSGGGQGLIAASISAFGGNETRPMNASVMYIIRVQ